MASQISPRKSTISLYIFPTSYIRQQVATSAGSPVVVAAVVLPPVPRVAALESSVRFVISDRLSMNRPKSESGDAGILPGVCRTLDERLHRYKSWLWSFLVPAYQIAPFERHHTVMNNYFPDTSLSLDVTAGYLAIDRLLSIPTSQSQNQHLQT